MPVRTIQIKTTSEQFPAYATQHAAGADVKAQIQTPITIVAGSSAIIPTGLFLEIPEGYECQVRSRSGLAAKNQVFVLNSPGTIDSDYRGEIKVILMNAGKQDFVIQNGDRIAQLVFAEYYRADFTVVQELCDTKRGSGGFGSTDIQ